MSKHPLAFPTTSCLTATWSISYSRVKNIVLSHVRKMLSHFSITDAADWSAPLTVLVLILMEHQGNQKPRYVAPLEIFSYSCRRSDIVPVKAQNLNLEITVIFNFNILKIVSTIKNYASTRLMNLYLKILKHQFISSKKYLLKPEMVANTFNPTTQRAEASGSSWVSGQPCLYTKFNVNQG